MKFRIVETKGDFYIEKYEMNTFLYIIPLGSSWYRVNYLGNCEWGKGYKYNSLEDANKDALKFMSPDKIHEIKQPFKSSDNKVLEGDTKPLITRSISRNGDGSFTI